MADDSAGEFELPKEDADLPFPEWLEKHTEFYGLFFSVPVQPEQTSPEIVADFIPDDGTWTYDPDGIWTWQLLMGWPVRIG